MKVALYARVSTDDKDQDPERQFIQCRRYCEMHEHDVIGEFKDIGISGDTAPESRSGYQEAMNAKPEGLVVYSMDRLSRQHPSKIMRYLGQMKDRGMNIISVSEPAFNMDGEFVDLIHYIIAWFNNWYLSNLKKNIKTGLENAKAKGKTLGRPTKRFNRRRAVYLLGQGVPQRKVAAELGVSVGTINRIRKVMNK